MPKPIPAVSLPINPARSVAFDLPTLVRIEEATGRSVIDAVVGFAEPAANGQHAIDGTAMARKLSAKYISGFLAGCVGTSVEHLHVVIPQQQVGECFGLLLPKFIEAAVSLLPQPAQAEAHPSEAASAASPPGPASISA